MLHGARSLGSGSVREGCSGHTLLEWVKKSEVNSGKRVVCRRRPQKLKALKGEVRNLWQPNDILREALAYFAGRNSTARSNDDRLYRRASGCLWGLADLSDSADRPVRLSRAAAEISEGALFRRVQVRRDKARSAVKAGSSLSPAARREIVVKLCPCQQCRREWHTKPV